jgi:hypothetical protein
VSAALSRGVVHLHTAAIEPVTPRALQYRIHHTRPGNAQSFTEWCIETQLMLAFDCDEPDAYSVLAAFHPAREGTVAESIEQLLDLAAEAARSEEWGSTDEHHAAVDDYRAALYDLARALRGAA